jgi:AraC family transcriptional regulator, transcriptional activator FtrA
VRSFSGEAFLQNARLRIALTVAQMPTIVKNVPIRVAVLAFDGMRTFEFGIAVELFGLPRPELQSWYDFEVCGLERGPLEATGGISIVARRGLEGLRRADTIVVPGWRDPRETPPARLTRALVTAHERGARLVSLCSGFYVLAATGLLDGRRATTHWKEAEYVRERFPQIELELDSLYVDEGDILTSAGSAAGIDLCLHIIRKDFGALVANVVARRLVVAPHREGGQAQFINTPVGEQQSPWLSRLLDWAQSRIQEPLTVEQLASQAHVSKRTLTRRFADTTGTSPLQWLTDLRVRHAKDLLETTALSVEEIAGLCGFGSAPTLRHHFRERVKLSPNDYRLRFQMS